MNKFFAGILSLINVWICFGSESFDERFNLLREKFGQCMEIIQRYEEFLEQEHTSGVDRDEIRRLMLYTSLDLQESFDSMKLLMIICKNDLVSQDKWFQTLNSSDENRYHCFEWEYVKFSLDEFEFDVRSSEKQIKNLRQRYLL